MLTPPVPTLDDVLRQELRRAVCRKCTRRPAFTRQVSLDRPLSCEPHCPVFKHLVHFREVARLVDPILRGADESVRTAIRNRVKNEQAADGCNSGSSPLAMQADEVARRSLE